MGKSRPPTDASTTLVCAGAGKCDHGHNLVEHAYEVEDPAAGGVLNPNPDTCHTKLMHVCPLYGEATGPLLTLGRAVNPHKQHVLHLDVTAALNAAHSRRLIARY